jgi:hypothetical protein
MTYADSFILVPLTLDSSRFPRLTYFLPNFVHFFPPYKSA